MPSKDKHSSRPKRSDACKQGSTVCLTPRDSGNGVCNGLFTVCNGLFTEGHGRDGTTGVPAGGGQRRAITAIWALCAASHCLISRGATCGLSVRCPPPHRQR